ncbi:hypothetical protein BH09BAC3_BH09BAC3_37880 [soil metagenome]
MKVIGIGGIFFKSEQADKLALWYNEHLGIGPTLPWAEVENKTAHDTVWKTLHGNANVFEGTNKNLVINYLVDDLDGLLEKLRVDSVTAKKIIDSDGKGKSASILDPEGNKCILWESNGGEPKIAATNPRKVTGLGGVFFKSSNPKELNQWYAEHLGIEATQWGCNFLWHDANNPNERVPAITVWNPFAEDTTYFNPGKSDFMFNYRVLNLVELLKTLEASGVQLAGTMEEFSYGKFGWIIDPDGNKIELWEPIDDGF